MSDIYKANHEEGKEADSLIKSNGTEPGKYQYFSPTEKESSKL